MTEDIVLISPKLEDDNEFVAKFIPRADAERLVRAGFYFGQDQWLSRQHFLKCVGLGFWLNIDFEPDQERFEATIYKPKPSAAPCTVWSAYAKKDIVRLARRALKQAVLIIKAESDKIAEHIEDVRKELI
jgi:hypothetical protein